jgi:hypothetical protein
MKKKMRRIVWGAVLLFFGSFVLYPNLYIAPERRALVNLLLRDWLPWNGVIFEEHFPIWESGAEIQIELQPEYTSEYFLTMTFQEEHRDKDFTYSGRLRLEIFHRGILKKTIEIGQGAVFSNGWSTHQTVWLASFYLPLEDRYWENLSLRLTVLEPDKNLEKYSESMIVRVEDGFYK